MSDSAISWAVVQKDHAPLSMKFSREAYWSGLPVAKGKETKGFRGGSDGNKSTCNAGDMDSITGLGRSLGGGRGNPLQCSCLENLHGQRSLEGYSPQGHKQLDMSE